MGCAFDCAAIALNLYLRASATPVPSGFAIAYHGPNENEISHDENNLILRSMRRAAAAKHSPLPSVRLDVQNDIPLGVGLGSSSAAIVAGILLGSALCGGPLPPDQALGLASEIEGHPDNVAAALHGGFVVAAAVGSAPGVLVAKAAVSENLNFVAVIPEIPLPTEKARAVLPEQYSRRDVVGNLQRTACWRRAFSPAANSRRNYLPTGCTSLIAARLFPESRSVWRFGTAIWREFSSAERDRPSWPSLGAARRKLARRWWANFGAEERMPARSC